jgi:Zn-dependent protease/CBS domain-containing protein
MKASLIIGRVRGIEVGVHWSVFVVLGLLTVGLGGGRLPEDVEDYSTGAYWLAAAITAVLFLTSILAHELAHSLVAVQRGVRVNRITLWLLGGVAQLETGATRPRDEWQIAIVGPLTSLAIGAVAGATALTLDATNGPELVVAMLAWLAGVNLVIAVFNLVPAAPLDGGRILRAALWAWKKDPERAAVIAAKAGQTFGVILMVVGGLLFMRGAGGLWYVLLGWFLINEANAEELHASMKQRLGSVHVRDVMSPAPISVPPGIDVETFVDEYVMRHRYSSFPVVDAQGKVHGILTWRRVKQLPREKWRTTRVADLACPLEEVPTARPGEPLASVLERMSDECAEGRALVMNDGVLVGVLAPSDVRRAFELAEVVQGGHHAMTSR